MIRSLLLFHRWVALTSGVIIVVIAVTGALLTVEQPLYRLLRPRLWRASAGQSLPLDTLVARVRVALPDAQVSWIAPAAVPRRATLIGTDADQQVWIDAATGTVLGIRSAGQMRTTPTVLVRRLHGSLAIPGVGRTLVIIGTLATLLLALSGLWLWWPDKLWRIRGDSMTRVVFDLHHLLGITGLALFVVMSATGLMLAGGSTRRSGTPGLAPAQPAAAPGTVPASLDAALRAARAAAPGNNIRLVTIPRDLSQPLVLQLRPPGGDVARPPTLVTVDRYRAVALHVQGPGEASSVERLNTWLLALHSGQVGGPPAMILWAAAALALAGGALTGLLMWWNGRTAHRLLARAAAKQPA